MKEAICTEDGISTRVQDLDCLLIGCLLIASRSPRGRIEGLLRQPLKLLLEHLLQRWDCEEFVPGRSNEKTPGGMLYRAQIRRDLFVRAFQILKFVHFPNEEADKEKPPTCVRIPGARGRLASPNLPRDAA